MNKTSNTVSCPICDNDTNLSSPAICEKCGWLFFYFSDFSSEFDDLVRKKKEIFKNTNEILNKTIGEYNTISKSNTELKRELKNRKEQISSLEDKIKNQEVENSKIHNNLNDQKSTIKNKDQEIKQLKSELKKANSLIDNLKRKLTFPLFNNQKKITYKPNIKKIEVNYSLNQVDGYFELIFSSKIKKSEFPHMLLLFSKENKFGFIAIDNSDFSIYINNNKNIKIGESQNQWYYTFESNIHKLLKNSDFYYSINIIDSNSHYIIKPFIKTTKNA